MKPLPWYLNPQKTCKVMNRLADRTFTKYSSPELVRGYLDLAQELLWAKVENYYQKRGIQC